jgi:hypothetical protein
MIDPASGLAIPQQRVGLRGAKVRGEGTITYVCHTCGHHIVKPWEVFYVDTDWASYLVPLRTTPTTTTHHDWHMASQHED